MPKLVLTPAEARLTGLDAELLVALERYLSIIDPRKEYARRRLGLPPVWIRLAKRIHSDLIFPTGLWESVESWLAAKGLRVEVEDRQVYVRPTGRLEELPEWLYPHQRRALATLLERPRGLICAPTGSGKTVVAAMAARLFGDARVLVIVPTLDLLDQTVATFAKLLGERIGSLSGRGHEWQRVSIGTVQTLSAHCDTYAQELAQTQLVIVDECHRASADSYVEVLKACGASRRIGLSATPNSSNGLDRILEGSIGPLLLRIEESEVVSQQLILRPTVLSLTIPPLKVPASWRRLRPDPAEVYRVGIVENDLRNHYVVALLSAFLSSGKKGGLVIVKAIEHGRKLAEAMGRQGYYVPFIHGSVAKTERQEIIEGLRNGQLAAAIASSILNEGADIPPLRLVIQAAGGSSPRTAIQQVGRVLRCAPGKDQALYIEFADQDPLLIRAWRRRLRALESRHPGCHRNVGLQEAIALIQNLDVS